MPVLGSGIHFVEVTVFIIIITETTTTTINNIKSQRTLFLLPNSPMSIIIHFFSNYCILFTAIAPPTESFTKKKTVQKNNDFGLINCPSNQTWFIIAFATCDACSFKR